MDTLARLLLTYVLHSTLLLGAAALACLALRGRRLAVQEALLRAALVGGFVTAGLQVGLGVRPLGGSLALPSSHAVATVAPVPATAASRAPLPATDDGSWHGRALAPPAPAWQQPPLAPVLQAAAAHWRSALAVAWVALALAALARLAVAALRLRRLLCDRRPLADGALPPQVGTLGAALGLRRPVRLSAAPRLVVPLATGVLRPEVCLPPRAVSELGKDEQVALCAHELAHVARRDPAWILLARAVECLAPVQPLNAWARRRLQDLAECLSDDLAVAVSARPLGLARSLVDVASWTIGERFDVPAPAAGALRRNGRLGHRVERLMDPLRRPERPRRILLPAAALLVAATAVVAPSVSGGSGTTDEPAAAPQARPAAPAAAAATAQPAPRAKVGRKAEARPEDLAAAEARLEELGRAIEARAKTHEADMERLEEQIEAAAARMKPDEAQLQEISEELERAAQELAESVTTGLAREQGKDAERAAEARRRMADAEKRLREATSGIKAPEAEMRALAEKARELAEQARPTDAELAEIRELSRRIAHESLPDPEQMRRLTREAAEQGRVAAEQAREAMERAQEEMERAREELRRAEERRRAGEPDPRP